MEDEMKLRYRLFRRTGGNYFCEDRQTHIQHSLRTKDKAEGASGCSTPGMRPTRPRIRTADGQDLFGSV